jgi:hypothetical protein
MECCVNWWSDGPEIVTARLKRRVEMESGANGIVFNGQNVGGKLRRRRQNVLGAWRFFP